MAARIGAKVLTLLCFIFINYQALSLIKYSRTFENQPVISSSKADHLLSHETVPSSIQQLRETINLHNSNPPINNVETFGPLSDNAPVFVIQVHDRKTYLQALIESLSRVPEINESLVVFSHDVHSEQINHIVQGIKFANVVQIFYPYSMQLYPNGFPGPETGNVSSFSPVNGFRRNPTYSQIKLHWIWKLTQVFRDLDVLRNHNGPRIFLEEDHLVAPDILHSLKLIQELKSKDCPACLIVLGGYPQKNEFETGDSLLWDAVQKTWFFSSGNNMGMVFDQTFWKSFTNCSDLFCSIDDYNWDWSLQHLNQKCFPQRLQILKPFAPRVYHVGDCGTHSKVKGRCGRMEQLESVRQIQSMLGLRQKELFPKTFRRVSQLNNKRRDAPEPYGGWADRRDQELCLIIAKERK